jgi:hypothetical protein
LEAGGAGLFKQRPNLLQFAWKDFGKPRKTPVRAAGSTAEIQTGNLTDISVEIYRYTDLVDVLAWED